ncbi:hypothetical protein [Metabacillus litoralis]|uniref:hypothetical protein n=1 Tax=Metabacillus litoralis TaxID=152268 RepID=UPI001CFD9092|nr:hypothetical protein [Metabacillus litoralis]
MRKKAFFITLLLISLTFLVNHIVKAEELNIKVMELKTNKVISESQSSLELDKEGKKAIKSIKKITVEANPLPNEGYLFKLTFTKPVKVKNKWFNDIISEVILICDSTHAKEGKIVLYTDENTPMFFDIEYEFTILSEKLNIK